MTHKKHNNKKNGDGAAEDGHQVDGNAPIVASKNGTKESGKQHASTKDAAAAEEAIDPTQYRENRLAVSRDQEFSHVALVRSVLSMLLLALVCIPTSGLWTSA